MPRVPRRWAALIVAAALACGVLPSPAPVNSVEPTTGFVTREGTYLVVEGAPYAFSGVNIYNANSDGWCGHEMRSAGRLAAALDSLDPNTNAIRAWFFQPLSQTADGTARDWSAFDNTLAEAAARGLRVIVTLSDHWGECGSKVGTGVKSPDWYRTGYTEVEPGMLASYRDYVGEVVQRYRDNPAVLFWQLMNEAETKDLTTGDCEPGGELVLRDFGADVSGVIKGIDPNHLVSLGTMGGPQCGPHRDGYRTVHDVETIDVCEFHDYSPTEAVPTFTYEDGYDNGLASRIAICAELGKPIFVGEAGIPRATGLAERADMFRQKRDAQFGLGVSGFLAWNFSDVELDATYDLRGGDPALRVLMPPPFVTISAPHDGAVYQRGQAVVADFTCYDPRPDFHAHCETLTTGDGLIDTWTVGTNALVVRAESYGNMTEVTQQYEVLPGNPRATGTEFRAADIFDFPNGETTVQADCHEDGVSTVSYTVSGPVGGVLAGPFPGTFTESGTFTMGPEYALPGEGVKYGDLETFSATFTIDSPNGQVVGTKSLLIPGYHGGICDTPSAGSPFSGANLRLIRAVAYDVTITTADGVSRDAGISSDFLYYSCGARCDDSFASRFITDGSPTDIDADGDGVDDRIDVGVAAFDDGKGTTGTIDDAADNTVLVLRDPGGVRITASGGTTSASFTVCGVTLQLTPGSETVVSCGSITAEVLAGEAQLVLDGGLLVVGVPAGAIGFVDQNGDGSYVVKNLSDDGASLAITLDGVTTTLETGQTLDVEAWDFIGFEDPVDNLPQLNVVRAGQVVPLKWRVLDANGHPVTDLDRAIITATTVTCSAGISPDLVEEAVTGESGLQNLGDGYYQVNWKSAKEYAGSCKVLGLDIGDGVIHAALFEFSP